MRGMLMLFLLVAGVVAFAAISGPVEAALLRPLPDNCRSFMSQALRDEHASYRRVQYGSDYPGVLTIQDAATSDLIPYLTLNFHAFSCRLASLCEAIDIGVNPFTSGRPSLAEPIGCSRMFPVRGRWWNDEQRGWGYLEDGLRT